SAKRLRRKSFDCIIGLGGGSAMDMAKALSIVLTHSEPIWMYANLSNRSPLPIKNCLIPVIAIPTTSGTGSEVTPYVVLTNSETNQKGTIQDSSVFPKVSILDPFFTQNMPRDLTASTGIDALAHALESYINVSKVSFVAEWAGKESIRLIFGNLIETLNNPENLNYRVAMAWASSLAGIAISHRGTTTPHAIAEALGALTSLPHSHCVSVSTLPVLKQTWKKTKRRLAELYQSTFAKPLGKKSDSYSAEAFVIEVEKLLELTNMNKTVESCLRKNEIERLNKELLDNVVKYKFRPLKQHPVEFKKDDLSVIINEILGK
ncbi:MAG: iron-containing alcohol dehydrogenase family protein, partial [Candidatus Anammoxibacter sp.]